MTDDPDIRRNVLHFCIGQGNPAPHGHGGAPGGQFLRYAVLDPRDDSGIAVRAMQQVPWASGAPLSVPTPSIPWQATQFALVLKVENQSKVRLEHNQNGFIKETAPLSALVDRH